VCDNLKIATRKRGIERERRRKENMEEDMKCFSW
jgi:hypothetical protein